MFAVPDKFFPQIIFHFFWLFIKLPIFKMTNCIPRNTGMRKKNFLTFYIFINIKWNSFLQKSQPIRHISIIDGAFKCFISTILNQEHKSIIAHTIIINIIIQSIYKHLLMITTHISNPAFIHSTQHIFNDFPTIRSSICAITETNKFIFYFNNRFHLVPKFHITMNI